MKNICTNGNRWFNIILYDIDIPALSASEVYFIHHTMNKANSGFIIYKTLNGFHIVGLSPVSRLDYALAMTSFDIKFDSYYSGHIIRISPKEGESQELVMYNKGGYVIIPNLWNVFAPRFNLEKMSVPLNTKDYKHRLVFEKYPSMNEGDKNNEGDKKEDKTNGK